MGDGLRLTPSKITGTTRGSILDADPPAQGVNFPRRITTAGEAKARRKRTRTTERQEQENERISAFLVGSAKVATPLEPAARAKLVKVLGLLGSGHDSEILTAARQAERLRAERGRTWDDLIR